jgi:hypothetical protein
MSYIINKSDGSILLTLSDGVLDTSTSLGLLGRNYTGYGEVQNENFVFLLENFAGISPPARPITGQVWYNSGSGSINVYNGEAWAAVGSANVSEDQPDGALGGFWLKSTTNQLFVFTADGWKLVGPEDAEGFGKSRAETTVIKDINEQDHAVIIFYIDSEPVAICSSDTFSISLNSPIPNFFNIQKGINLSSTAVINGNLSGNATTASRLENSRSINGVPFDGQTDITVTSSTTGTLIKGDYLSGSDFDGSTDVVLSVNATPSNFVGRIVARDSNGDFSAGDITASNFIGNLTGDVTSSTGTSTFNKIVCNSLEGPLTGNATAASKLTPGKAINGVLFNGSTNITVPASAETLTGTRIKSTVTESSLTTVGVLNSLAIQEFGISIGSSNNLKMFVDSTQPKIEETTENGLFLVLKDSTRSGSKGFLKFLSSAKSSELGGESDTSILPDIDKGWSLGATSYRFNKIYSETFEGTATNSLLSNQTSNLNGGILGSVVYQTAANTTAFVTPGTPGQVLKMGNTGHPVWGSSVLSPLLKGDYLTGNISFDGTVSTTWSVDATSSNTGGKIVARDSNGDFSARIITAPYHNFTDTSSIYYYSNQIHLDSDSQSVFKGNGGSFRFYMSSVSKPGGGSFAVASDSRLKKDIVPYEKSLDSIVSLNPIKYKYNQDYFEKHSITEEFRNENEYVGLSAQNLLNTDFDNCVTQDEQGHYNVDNSEMIYALINSVKELNNKILELQNELQSLKGE